MLAYTIAAARESGVFESVIVSTDTEDVANIARVSNCDASIGGSGASNAIRLPASRS